jgi:hypothetical protein
MKNRRTTLSQAHSKYSLRAKSRRSSSHAPNTREAPGKRRPLAKAPDPYRCQFLSSIGRQCRMPRSAHHRTLCVNHAKKEEDRRSETQPDKRVARELASLSGEFKTAIDVNHVLGKLFALVAQRRIPRRDAVALAYIAQLLLQSLPAVQREVKLARGFDAWQETIEAALPPAETDEILEEDDSDDASDEAERDEALDGPEPHETTETDNTESDEALNGVGTRQASSEAGAIEKQAVAELTQALLAAARDELRDAADCDVATRERKRDKSKRAEREPTQNPAPGSNLSLEEKTAVLHRVLRPIFRSPGPLEGSMQEMEVTLGEGWGLH